MATASGLVLCVAAGVTEPPQPWSRDGLRLQGQDGWSFSSSASGSSTNRSRALLLPHGVEPLVHTQTPRQRPGSPDVPAVWQANTLGSVGTFLRVVATRAHVHVMVTSPFYQWSIVGVTASSQLHMRVRSDLVVTVMTCFGGRWRQAAQQTPTTRRNQEQQLE